VNLSGVYAIVNRSEDRRYIGSSVDIPRRWCEHRTRLQRGLHTNKILQAAWDKYGAVSFDWVILEPVADRNEMIEREQYWIDRTIDPYNLSQRAGSGPKPGTVVSPEQCARLSAALTGKPKSASHRAAISAARKGKKFPNHAAALRGKKLPAETRAHMSAAHKRRYELHPRSEETRAKLSAALAGREFTPEWRAKISAAKKGRPWSAANRLAHSRIQSALPGVDGPACTNSIAHVDEFDVRKPM
jgi:group I intron endonuclease